MYQLLGYLRDLPTAKQCTVCLMLVVGELQLLSTLYIVSQLFLLLLPFTMQPVVSGSSTIHVALLFIMLGVVLQVCCAVLFVVFCVMLHDVTVTYRRAELNANTLPASPIQYDCLNKKSAVHLGMHVCVTPWFAVQC